LVDVDDRGIDDVDIKNDGRVFGVATEVNAGRKIGIRCSFVRNHSIRAASVGVRNAKTLREVAL